MASNSYFAPGDFAQVAYDSVPIWSTDVGTNSPFGYLDRGEIVVILQFSDASGADYYLALSQLGCGYVYADNLILIT